MNPEPTHKMTSMFVAASIVAIVCTVLATLAAVVFCMAMGANAKPPEIRALKLWMAGLSLLGVAGVVAGIVLLRAGQPGWASLVAFAPTAVFGIILVVSLIRS